MVKYNYIKQLHHLWLVESIFREKNIKVVETRAQNNQAAQSLIWFDNKTELSLDTLSESGAKLELEVIDGNVIHDAVGPGQIDVLKDAGLQLPWHHLGNRMGSYSQ